MNTYDLFAEAIRSQKQITCTYDGYYREFCPHTLGRGPKGNVQALCFQFGGGSSSGLPAGGNWRCVQLDRVLDASLRDGQWYTSDVHTRPQTCVQIVDVEVLH